ncbi:MAG: type II secretion system protein [Gammaproteobacteria bacterium]
MNNKLINQSKQQGFSLIEMIVVVGIAGMIFASLSTIVGEMFNTQERVESDSGINQEAAFVTERLVNMIARSSSFNLKNNDADHVHVDLETDPQQDMNKDGTFDPVDKIEFHWDPSMLEIRMQALSFDATGDGKIDGHDKFKYILTSNISAFTISESKPVDGRYDLLHLDMTFTDTDGQTLNINTSVRVGGQL